MIKLSKEQRSRLELKRDSNHEKLSVYLKNLTSRHAPGSGHVADRLCWDALDMIEADLMAGVYRQLLEICDDPDSKATLESLSARHLEAILQWEPEYSTNPISNLEEGIMLKAFKDVYETVQTLISDQSEDL